MKLHCTLSAINIIGVSILEFSMADGKNAIYAYTLNKHTQHTRTQTNKHTNAKHFFLQIEHFEVKLKLIKYIDKQ